MKPQKTVYYDDILNDEFSEAKITPKKIDGDYVYIHKSVFKKFTHFFWYRIVATPIAWVFLKCKFSHKIVNRKVLKQCGGGYFLYGNHTQDVADAFIPTFVAMHRHVYVIVHPNNVSMPVLGKISPSLGALPLPDNLAATRNFVNAVHTRVQQGNVVCIYPEAHIWPYCTEIRPFSDASFRYPVKEGKPVFCFTNTYQTKREGGKVRIVTYVDGPFFADKTLAEPEQKLQLRNEVFSTMVKRSKMSNVRVVNYVKREDQQ